MSLILAYKESGGVAFSTKETCNAGRTKKEREPCASAKTGISLLYSPPHILFTRLPSPIPNTSKPLNQKLRSPQCFHFSSYLSRSGISIWSEVAKEKKLQWNIQHIHIWLLLMEGSGVVKLEKCWGWWGGLTPLKPITSAFFCFTDFEACAFVEPENDLNWHSFGCWLFDILKEKNKTSSASMHLLQLEIKFVEPQAY